MSAVNMPMASPDVSAAVQEIEAILTAKMATLTTAETEVPKPCLRERIPKISTAINGNVETRGRKRKEKKTDDIFGEEVIELYTNKNFIPPVDTFLETIFEVPKKSKTGRNSIQSAVKHRRWIKFDDCHISKEKQRRRRFRVLKLTGIKRRSIDLPISDKLLQEKLLEISDSEEEQCTDDSTSFSQDFSGQFGLGNGRRDASVNNCQLTSSVDHRNGAHFSSPLYVSGKYSPGGETARQREQNNAADESGNRPVTESFDYEMADLHRDTHLRRLGDSVCISSLKKCQFLDMMQEIKGRFIDDSESGIIQFESSERQQSEMNSQADSGSYLKSPQQMKGSSDSNKKNRVLRRSRRLSAKFEGAENCPPNNYSPTSIEKTDLPFSEMKKLNEQSDTSNLTHVQSQYNAERSTERSGPVMAKCSDVSCTKRTRKGRRSNTFTVLESGTSEGEDTLNVYQNTCSENNAGHLKLLAVDKITVTKVQDKDTSSKHSSIDFQLREGFKIPDCLKNINAHEEIRDFDPEKSFHSAKLRRKGRNSGLFSTKLVPLVINDTSDNFAKSLHVTDPSLKDENSSNTTENSKRSRRRSRKFFEQNDELPSHSYNTRRRSRLSGAFSAVTSDGITENKDLERNGVVDMNLESDHERENTKDTCSNAEELLITQCGQTKNTNSEKQCNGVRENMQMHSASYNEEYLHVEHGLDSVPHNSIPTQRPLVNSDMPEIGHYLQEMEHMDTDDRNEVEPKSPTYYSQEPAFFTEYEGNAVLEVGTNIKCCMQPDSHKVDATEVSGREQKQDVDIPGSSGLWGYGQSGYCDSISQEREAEQHKSVSSHQCALKQKSSSCYSLELSYLSEHESDGVAEVATRIRHCLQTDQQIDTKEESSAEHKEDVDSHNCEEKQKKPILFYQHNSPNNHCRSLLQRTSLNGILQDETSQSYHLQCDKENVDMSFGSAEQEPFPSDNDFCAENSDHLKAGPFLSYMSSGEQCRNYNVHEKTITKKLGLCNAQNGLEALMLGSYSPQTCIETVQEPSGRESSDIYMSFSESNEGKNASLDSSGIMDTVNRNMLNISLNDGFFFTP